MPLRLIALLLLTLPFGLGCTGTPPAPTEVTEDERQKLLDEEKRVEMEERAHQQSAR